jgi:hypothetical protein
MTPETKVKNAWLKAAKQLGLEVIRLSFSRGATVGWPDNLFLVPGGLPLFLEFKAPGKTPTPMQTYRATLLWELGYDIRWTDSADAARAFLASRMGTFTLHDPGKGPPGGPSCWRVGA